eukprot:1138385-Pelagomonas_calceolata.AAC.3
MGCRGLGHHGADMLGEKTKSGGLQAGAWTSALYTPCAEGGLYVGQYHDLSHRLNFNLEHPREVLSSRNS